MNGHTMLSAVKALVTEDENMPITVRRGSVWFCGLVLFKQLKQSPTKIFHQLVVEFHKKSVSADQLTVSGIAIGYSLLQGGPPFPLARSLYEFMAYSGDDMQKERTVLSVRDMPKSPAYDSKRCLLTQLCRIKDLNEEDGQRQLTDCLADQVVLESLADSGWDINANPITWDSLDVVIQEILSQELIYKRLPYLNALKQGFSLTKLLEVVQLYPEQMRVLFVKPQLNSETVFELMQLSRKPETDEEQRAYGFLQEYMVDMEGRNLGISEEGETGHVINLFLKFVTGSDCVPACGLSNLISIHFGDQGPWPTAETFFEELTIPVQHKDYKEFCKYFDMAITEGLTFELM